MVFYRNNFLCCYVCSTSWIQNSMSCWGTLLCYLFCLYRSMVASQRLHTKCISIIKASCVASLLWTYLYLRSRQIKLYSINPAPSLLISLWISKVCHRMSSSTLWTVAVIFVFQLSAPFSHTQWNAGEKGHKFSD